MEGGVAAEVFGALAVDDQQARTVAVLLLDGTECDAGANPVPVDASLRPERPSATPWQRYRHPKGAVRPMARNTKAPPTERLPAFAGRHADV
jgi:hypothetical protein